ncbi:DUF962 domain-containing protein [Natronospirillum operosum]|uniref:DUF962 domain-containing protein n=1 Tax=Natronospirillum operosum TaxID=2759953 RepID=A0A4Z0W8B2_9GAMM|nr:Mpo1-like protein [Natronospirillum operosum]TGG92025.1 DUF962 domain-containing protein [Natronospirillum operosum]
MTRSIQDWLDAYSVSHQNPTNKKIHWVCVPGIFWSIMGLLWVIPKPAFMAALPWLNWATLSLVVIVGFYVRLSWPLTLGMAAFTLLCLLSLAGLQSLIGVTGVLITSVAVFIILWIGQFIGHHIEGQKPSFFEDIQFLMIGPAWVMAFIFDRLHWRY